MSPDHPSDDTWERLATGELDAATRAGVLAHVVGCPACTRTWRVLRTIAREARAFDPGVPAAAPTERPDRVRRALWIGGGVAVAVAAALLLWIRFDRPPPAAEQVALRGGDDARIEVRSPSPGPSPRLAWRPVAAAEHYTVAVFSAEGRPLWRRDRLTSAEVTVEPPLPAGSYLWQVEAWRGGRRIASSAPAPLAVAP